MYLPGVSSQPTTEAAFQLVLCLSLIAWLAAFHILQNACHSHGHRLKEKQQDSWVQNRLGAGLAEFIHRGRRGGAPWDLGTSER